MFSGTVVSSTSTRAVSMRRRTRSRRSAYSSRKNGSSFGSVMGAGRILSAAPGLVRARPEPTGQIPSIDRQGATGDISGVVGVEAERGAGYLRRLAEAAHRNALDAPAARLGRQPLRESRVY